MLSNGEDFSKENVVDLIKNLEVKMDKFSSILEKFGLDLITKIGQQNTSFRILSDKIDELNKATIQIKGLTPKLTNIIENQKYLESELDLMKSLVQKLNTSIPREEVEIECVQKDKIAIDKKESIKKKLTTIKIDLENLIAPENVVNVLESIKEEIFELKGGSKILYDISQTINKLNESKTLTSELKDTIKDKISFWINKL